VVEWELDTMHIFIFSALLPRTPFCRKCSVVKQFLWPTADFTKLPSRSDAYGQEQKRENQATEQNWLA
jgi:hypothetical protein